MKDYFSFISIIAFGLSVVMIFFIIRVLRTKNVKWGKSILISFFLGLFICMLVATRDGYGFSDDALISIDSSLSLVLSILGIALVLTSIGAIFIKNIKYRRFTFILIGFIFVSKFLIVEILRFITLF